MIALLLLLAASAARAQQYTRAQLQDYLASVYTLTPKQAWTELNDLQVLDMYNNLVRRCRQTPLRAREKAIF